MKDERQKSTIEGCTMRREREESVTENNKSEM